MLETEPTSPASNACQKARAGPEAVRVTMGPEPEGCSADPLSGFSTSLAQRACLLPGGASHPLHSSRDQLIRAECEHRKGDSGGGEVGAKGKERKGRETQIEGEGLCP